MWRVPINLLTIKRNLRNKNEKIIDISKTPILTIARIHGTVFALLLGSLIIFYLRDAFLNIDALKDIVIRDAKRINEINPPHTVTDNTLFSVSLWDDDLDASITRSEKHIEDPNWSDRISKFADLASGRNKIGSPEYRGKRILILLISLTNNYPFRETCAKGFERIQFDTIQDVETWLKDIRHLNLTYNIYCESNSKHINKLVTDFHNHLIKTRQTSPNIGISNPFDILFSPKNIFEQYKYHFKQIDSIINSVENNLSQLKEAKKKYPSETILIVATTISTIFFFTIIMIPIYWVVYKRKVRNITYTFVTLYLPSGCYLSLFIFCIWKVCKVFSF